MFPNLYIKITLKKLYPHFPRTILHSNKLVLTLELPGYENNYNHTMTLQFFLQLFLLPVSSTGLLSCREKLYSNYFKE